VSSISHLAGGILLNPLVFYGSHPYHVLDQQGDIMFLLRLESWKAETQPKETRTGEKRTKKKKRKEKKRKEKKRKNRDLESQKATIQRAVSMPSGINQD